MENISRGGKIKMGYKTLQEKIREGIVAGTFEGNMKSQGKDIRFFSDEYFRTHTSAECAREMTQEEYEYYQKKVHLVMDRESQEQREQRKKMVDDFQNEVEQDRQKSIEYVTKKLMSYPASIRPNIDKTKQDIKNIIGQPFVGDYSYREKLKDYVGMVEKGEVPEDVKIG
jgi:hypothetical protein